MRKTREDTKYFMRTYHSGNFCEDAQVMLKEDAEDLVDEMYDDFESGICENCKWYNTKSLANFCDNIDSPSTYHQITEVSFGCNKFERKDK